MLVQREPSDEDIHNWLTAISLKFNIPMERLNIPREQQTSHWKLYMQNNVQNYELNIISSSHGWITYGAVLIPDVVGTAQAQFTFYQYLLDLSGTLNGPHIGKQGNRLILTLETEKAGLSPISFGQKIVFMQWAYQLVYPQINTEAYKLGLKYRPD